MPASYPGSRRDGDPRQLRGSTKRIDGALVRPKLRAHFIGRIEVEVEVKVLGSAYEYIPFTPSQSRVGASSLIRVCSLLDNRKVYSQQSPTTDIMFVTAASSLRPLCFHRRRRSLIFTRLFYVSIFELLHF